MSTRSPWTRGHPPGELLSSYVDGEVDPDVGAEITAHIEGCSECRSSVDSFRSLRSTLRGVPTKRAPMSLNREVWQRIEQHDAVSRRGFRLPSTGRLVGFGTNALALAAIAVLVAIIAPGFNALFRQLASPSTIDASTTAAQPTVATNQVLPTITVWPTKTESTATATVGRPTEAPTSTVVTTVVSLPLEESKASGVAPKPAQPTPTRVEPTRTPVPVLSLAPQPTSVPVPTITVGAPTLRTVSGTVSFVDRKAKTITVSSPGSTGERAVTVVLSDGTQYSRADGRRTTFEDVGLADQVEVAGFEGAAPTNGVLASSVRISVSAVASSPQVRAPRVLYVADGAESIRAGQYGLTGDWARRLASTGYEVTTADPARVAWSLATLKDFDLVVIGSPATFSDAAIMAIKTSRLPILDGDPRLVQSLGLGVNVDPANPLRQAPAGRTIDVVASGSNVTRGMTSGETVVARETIYRTPIVSNGVVLAMVNDSGQRRAVWSQTGSAIYLGAWNSASGSNHTDAYWSMFDRSVVSLLGRDPSARPSVAGVAPTATFRAR